MKANSDMIARTIAGEHLLIPTGATALKVHGMVTLTESGALLWEKLQEESTMEDLVEVLLKEYDVDRETAEEDVEAFVGKMKRIGILEMDNE